MTLSKAEQRKRNYKIYYMITDRKRRLKDVYVLDVRCIETVVGVDLFFGCEYYNQLTDRAKIAHIEITAYDHDNIQIGDRLENYVLEQIRAFAKSVLGITVIPVEVKDATA